MADRPRRNERMRRSRRGQAAPDPLRGNSDPAVSRYERGPFPGMEPPPWPPLMVQLIETTMGRRFDPVLFAAYERARAYVGYDWELGAEAELARYVLADNRDAPRAHMEHVTSSKMRQGRSVLMGGARATTAERAAASMAPDPRDLGDG